MASPLRRLRLRALVLVIIFAALMAIAFAGARRQQARGLGHASLSPASSTILPGPDQGIISTQAATITVNSLSDAANGTDGLCTLREAITAANSNTASGAVAGECAAGSNSGADLISFTVTGSIDLLGVLPDISSDMTITGPGSSQLTVRRSTANLHRILTITSGNVSVSGLTVKDGMTPDTSNTSTSAGGGIRNAGTLTLTDVIVTANKTQSTLGAGPGGGIFNQGTLAMTNCAVTANITGPGTTGMAGNSGGGIANSGGSLTGSLTMTNCVVSNNETGTSPNVGGPGGGIFSAGPMTLIASTISNNVTGNGITFGGHGGGIFNSHGAALIINSTVSDNATGTTPSGSRGYAGGIFNENDLTIVGSTISGNSDGTGGAVLASRLLVVTNSTVSGNHSLSGGLHAGGSGTKMILTNCTVTANDGPGVQNESDLSSIARNNIFAGNTGADVTGNWTSQGHNLIGRFAPGGFTDGVNGDQVGTFG